MSDKDITDMLRRRAQECRSRAENALTPQERARWSEMAEYFFDLAKRWTMPDSKKT